MLVCAAIPATYSDKLIALFENLFLSSVTFLSLVIDFKVLLSGFDPVDNCWRDISVDVCSL